jgi:hypothetical protein
MCKVWIEGGGPLSSPGHEPTSGRKREWVFDPRRPKKG